MDTVKFSPTMVTMPSVTIEDHLRQAGSDIVRILTNPSGKVEEKYDTNEVYKAILELGKMFGTAETIPTMENIIRGNPEKEPHVRVPRVGKKGDTLESLLGQRSGNGYKYRQTSIT